MASRRILQDTITVFTDVGEDERYHTQYTKVVFKHCYCKAITGSYQSERPSDPVTVYLFDHTTTNMANFSLTGNGREYIVPYDASDQDTPPAAALNIRRVTRRKNGTRRMWHWEVYAE